MLKEELKYWYLRNHSLFEMMSDPEINHLCIISVFKQGDKNDIIFFSDTDQRRLYTIKEGALKICYLDQTGKEIITEILTEHDIFGCTSFSGNSTVPGRNEYAKVLTDHTKICTFDMDRFKEVVQTNPLLSLKYSTVINDKLVSFQQRYSDLIFKDVDTRIHDFFRNYAKSFGKQTGNRIEMNMFLTHQEIAEYTASSRQSVTTAINRLEAKGVLIYENRKTVIIPDITAY
jgi:CRP-like cAMP-binding protein